MLAALGDLLDDVLVRVVEPTNVASDTHARIVRRRGGSAANVAARAAVLGCRSRLLGQVGTDPIGAALVADLADDGVDTSMIRRRGSTGTIVALIDARGERTMLTDRQTCLDLRDPERCWLDDVTTLHVPFYSLAGGPIAATAATVIEWAHERSIPVSIDASSTAIIAEVGIEETRRRIAAARPAVVFANADEAHVLGLDAALGDALTVVKRGGQPAVVHRRGHPPIEVEAPTIPSAVDTTGAGDAFAAGFLTATDWLHDPVGASERGHHSAAALLRSR